MKEEYLFCEKNPILERRERERNMSEEKIDAQGLYNDAKSNWSLASDVKVRFFLFFSNSVVKRLRNRNNKRSS